MISFASFSAQYGKRRNSVSLKKIRQINNLVISLVKPLLSRNFFKNSDRGGKIFKFPQKFSLTEKNFRQISYLVISLVKPLLSRNLCEKSVRENFCNFHTVCEKRKKSHKKNFVKLTLVISLSKTFLSRNFCHVWN